jgi:hypothetical protein
MSLFSAIRNKIFGAPAAQAATSQPSGGVAMASAAPASGGASASGSSAPDHPAAAATATSAATGGVSSSGAGGGSQPVDVEAVLSGMAGKAGQTLDWRHSIVDLLKLLDLDSGLGARKELAQELGYTGDMNDSAKMNIWLHKQVMQKLAENGGKVPESLRS